MRLASGGKAQRKRAIRAAQTAVRLAPQAARAYDALGAAFLTGAQPANLTMHARTRLVKTLKSAIHLRDSDDVAAAASHDRLARTLSASHDENVSAIDDETAQRMSEAVHHARQAARLSPTRFSERARLLQGWEDALREYKQAELLDLRQRETMVDAMHEPFRAKQLQEEEDRAIAEEGLADDGTTDTRLEYDYEARRRQSGKTEL
eukprot:5914048-Prymnesium_polylepis.1